MFLLFAAPPATTTIPGTGTTTGVFVLCGPNHARPELPIPRQNPDLVPVFYGTPDWFSGMTSHTALFPGSGPALSLWRGKPEYKSERAALVSDPPVITGTPNQQPDFYESYMYVYGHRGDSSIYK